MEPKFAIPTRRDIDTKLVLGAILFGAGWGLTGYCPGPALASVFTGAIGVYVFLASMVAGMVLFKVWDRARQAAQENRINSATRQSGDNDQGNLSGPQKGITPWNVQSSYR